MGDRPHSPTVENIEEFGTATAATCCTINSESRVIYNMVDGSASGKSKIGMMKNLSLPLTLELDGVFLV